MSLRRIDDDHSKTISINVFANHTPIHQSTIQNAHSRLFVHSFIARRKNNLRFIWKFRRFRIRIHWWIDEKYVKIIRMLFHCLKQLNGENSNKRNPFRKIIIHHSFIRFCSLFISFFFLLFGISFFHWSEYLFERSRLHCSQIFNCYMLFWFRWFWITQHELVSNERERK